MKILKASLFIAWIVISGCSNAPAKAPGTIEELEKIVPNEIVFVPDREMIKAVEDFLGAVYRQFYIGEDIQIQIMNPAEQPIEVQTRMNNKEEKEQFIAWEYKIWLRDIMTMDCYSHGTPQIISAVCNYNQLIETYSSSSVSSIEEK